MKRMFAAAIAAVSIGGTMLVAIPAPSFAAGGVTLTIKPKAVRNGQSFAITAECVANAKSYPEVYSDALKYVATDKTPGEPLKVQMYVKYGTRSGEYTVTAVCVRPNGNLGIHTSQDIYIHYAPAPVPVPGGNNNPVKPIPGFKPNVVVETGFGGMARFVANHHPAG
jgi:hypothetical protein